MGCLRGADSRWLESVSDKVEGLVHDLLGVEVGWMAVGETGMYMNFPYSKEPVTVWVHHTLSGTKSNSAVGLDEVVYRLIKAVRDTRLGQEVLCEVVAVLIGGNILDRWSNMRVVLILKLGRNLTQTTTWRPLNLSNCMGKSKSTVCYHTPTLIIVSYFPYITCLLHLLFLIKHARISG